MIHHIKLKYILFLLISFSFIKAQEEIELVNGYYSKLITKETEDLLSFKVKVTGDYSYLKIKAEGNGKTENTNHIISFYQDQDLNNRQQLSQSVTDTSIMWLSRGQIEKDFYISIECAKIPCNFNLSLNGLNTAELGINEQYTYYVSDENEEMKFRLNSAIDYEDLEIEDLFITIWIKGNFEIIATLNNDKKEKSNYHFYSIAYQNFIDGEYDLNIRGNAGDLINVGVLLVHKNGNNYDFPKLKIEEGLEVANYLSENESHSYNIISSKMFLGYFYDFNNKILYPSADLDSYSLTTKDEEINYSIHFLNTTKYDGKGNNKYSPLLNGIYNFKILEEGTTIGLIPMKPEVNFNFLTYEIFPHDGDINVFIYKCENYPLCHIDENILEKSEKIKDYQSYYYVYNKNDWENEITPISKKQNMLIITCKKGKKLKVDGRNVCISIINMKTNIKLINNTDFIKEAPSYRRFIKKDNEDLYLFKGNKDQEIYLNIETFTGEIHIELEQEKDISKFEFENKILYIIPKNTDISLKIKALANSVYSINDNYYTIERNLKIGSNYLLNLEKNINLSPKDESNYLASEDYLYYIGIYPVNCLISIDEEENKLENNEFYQVILNTSENNYLPINKLNSDSNNNCLFYVSCHKLEEFNSNSNGIPLGNNTSQSFKFNKDHNSMVFSFPHTEIENDIKIDFKLFSEGKFKLNIMVDGKNFKEDNINSNKSNIQLNASDLKQKCEDFKFICKILFYLELEENESESNIEITIKSIKEKDNGESSDSPSSDSPSSDSSSDNTPSDNTPSDNEEDDDDDHKELIVILSIIGVIIVLSVGGGLFYYFRIYSKNRDLNQAVNQISFKDDKENEEEDMGDSLLD